MVRQKKDIEWALQQINSWMPVKGLDKNLGLCTTTKAMAHAKKKGKDRWMKVPPATCFAKLGKEKTGNNVSAKSLDY
jgi:hypothetical protein